MRSAAVKTSSLVTGSLFAFALLLFRCSLLTVLSAPTAVLWIVAILITEWGHYAALVCLLLALLSCGRGRLGRIAALIATAAALLCISPAVRARMMSGSLAERCASAFGQTTNAGDQSIPFSARDLFRGFSAPGVDVTEHIFARQGSKPLMLDLYQSRNRSQLQPLIVMVHGGSWKGGSKSQLPAINRYLAREQYSVAALNYRHAPKFRSPAAVEDTFRALEFLKANAAQLQLDMSRIVLIGRSAGGQIALSAAYAGREPGIRGVVGFYAPADLELGYREPSRRLVLDSKQMLEDYVGGSPGQNPQGYAAGSAVNFVGASTPPTLLIHGLLDPIVWPNQSELLAARLAEFKRPHLLVELPWATHGCDANLSGPSGQLSLYAIEHFLQHVFAATSGQP